MRDIVMLVVSLLTIVGCRSNIGTVAGQLRDRDWTLVSARDFAAMPEGMMAPTLRFGSGGRLGGNTGCNSAGAAYKADGDQLIIGALRMTRRACARREGNDLERAYVRAVEGARRFRIAGGELHLLSESGAVLARFR